MRGTDLAARLQCELPDNATAERFILLCQSFIVIAYEWIICLSPETSEDPARQEHYYYSCKIAESGGHGSVPIRLARNAPIAEHIAAASGFTSLAHEGITENSDHDDTNLVGKLQSNLFMGGPNVCTPAHWDSSHNVITQLAGHKTIWLWPPHNVVVSAVLSTFPRYIPVFRH